MTYTRANPSPEYAAMLDYCRLEHRGQRFTGDRTWQVYPWLREMCQKHKAQTLLDYGCGKGVQYAQRNVMVAGVGVVPSLAGGLGVSVTGYDPAVPDFSLLPVCRFDGVIIVDALEFIPEADFGWVLGEVFGFARHFVVVNAACIPGKKTWAPLTNGGQRTANWWLHWLDLCNTAGVDVVARLREETQNQWRIWRWADRGSWHGPVVDQGRAK